MLLDEIIQLNKERSGDYGHPLPNFLRASLDWSIKHTPFLHNPIDVAEMMDSFKGIRNIESVKWDNYRDKMGYVNCIDLMCNLYLDINIKNKTEFATSFLNEDDTYSDLDDFDKAVVVSRLKKLTFCEQYDLLLKCMEYLEGKE